MPEGKFLICTCGVKAFMTHARIKENGQNCYRCGAAMTETVASVVKP